MKDKIEARIKEIAQALEHSAASHNSMLGRLDELQKLLADINAVKEDVEAIIHPAEEAVS